MNNNYILIFVLNSYLIIAMKEFHILDIIGSDVFHDTDLWVEFSDISLMAHIQKGHIKTGYNSISSIAVSEMKYLKQRVILLTSCSATVPKFPPRTWRPGT